MGNCFAKSRPEGTPKKREKNVASKKPNDVPLDYKPPVKPIDDASTSESQQDTVVPPPDIPVKIEQQMVEVPRYQIIRGLGRGGYGFVALAKDTKTNQKVAIKFLERITVAGDSDEARWQETKVRISREILYHKMLTGHPHIIDFQELFLLPSYLCVVMEYARGGTLHGYVNRRYMQGNPMKEHEVREWFQQLMYAIQRINMLNIINRDIKLENCLIQREKDGSETLKLCDFGFAKHMERDSAPFTKAGSRPYIAPEVLFPMNFDGTVQWSKRDIWSCGVMLYSMLFGRYPFDPKRYRNQLDFYNDLKGAKFSFPTRPEVSDDVKELITAMLTPSPAERIGLNEVMQSTWFKTDLSSTPPVVDESSKENMQTDEEISELIDQAFQRLEHQPSDDDLIDEIFYQDDDEDFADIELK